MANMTIGETWQKQCPCPATCCGILSHGFAACSLFIFASYVLSWDCDVMFLTVRWPTFRKMMAYCPSLLSVPSFGQKNRRCL